MTEARWLDGEEQQTWRAFLWTSRLINEALERQLQRDSGIPHTYYVILAMLSEQPDRTMTMSQLAKIVRSSPSRLSHAITRLEEAGWVRRTPHPEDRRTTLAELTELGHDRVLKAAPGHVEEVRQRLFDPLTREEMLRLRDILRKVLPGLDADGEAHDVFGPAPTAGRFD
jgi:DNA-binding MarR family transcriptional regulator